MIDRDFEIEMDEHERKQNGHRDALTPTQEVARAAFYALTLKQLGKTPEEVRELVSRRYPRVKRLLDELDDGGQLRK